MFLNFLSTAPHLSLNAESAAEGPLKKFNNNSGDQKKCPPDLTSIHINLIMSGSFGTAIRELRIHLCQKSPASKGVREWVEKQYVPLKKANPSFPILIRECSNVSPKVFARYSMGREHCVDLSNKSIGEVSKTIESLGKAR